MWMRGFEGAAGAEGRSSGNSKVVKMVAMTMIGEFDD